MSFHWSKSLIVITDGINYVKRYSNNAFDIDKKVEWVTGYVFFGPHSMKRLIFMYDSFSYSLFVRRGKIKRSCFGNSKIGFSLKYFIHMYFIWMKLYIKFGQCLSESSKNKWNRNKSYMVVKWRHFNRTTLNMHKNIQYFSDTSSAADASHTYLYFMCYVGL